MPTREKKGKVFKKKSNDLSETMKDGITMKMKKFEGPRNKDNRGYTKRVEKKDTKEKTEKTTTAKSDHRKTQSGERGGYGQSRGPGLESL